MNIEIGKNYRVTNKLKKTYVEYIELVKDGSPSLMYHLVWRSGTWSIAPQDEDEVATLVDALADDFSGIVDFDDFQEAELEDCWDGCSEDLVSDDDPEYAVNLSDGFYGDEKLTSEYFNIVDYLEDVHGYASAEFYNQIEGPISVELAEV